MVGQLTSQHNSRNNCQSVMAVQVTQQHYFKIINKEFEKETPECMTPKQTVR